jgi:hypothetical protein
MKGNYPIDGGHLLLTGDERSAILEGTPHADYFIRPFIGSAESIRGLQRYCLWIGDEEVDQAEGIPEIKQRIELVRVMRAASKKDGTRKSAAYAHRFGEVRQGGQERYAIILPVHSSENRPFLPVSIYAAPTIVYGSAFALFEAPLHLFALLSSRLHLVWIATVCGKLETRYRYSNTLGWNTFPLPPVTEKNLADLTRCAEDILLAREVHFPATIADLYDPDMMPANLRAAHDHNDKVIERIYIGRRFRNDTERLEKLFDLYSRMTERKATSKDKTSGGRA